MAEKNFIVSKQSDRGADWRAIKVTAAILLGLAAAPTFAVMAIMTIAMSDASAMAMMPSPSFGWPLDGMSTMYLLMAIFHLPSWLRPNSAKPRDHQTGDMQ